MRVTTDNYDTSAYYRIGQSLFVKNDLITNEVQPDQIPLGIVTKPPTPDSISLEWDLVPLLLKSVHFQNRALWILNELVAADPAAITQLIELRTPINEKMLKLSDDPAVDVVVFRDKENEPWVLGLLGIINGFLGSDFRIQAHFQNNEPPYGNITSFTSVKSESEELDGK